MNLIDWLQDFLFFINDTVVPFIIALAFLFFIWNAFRFFIYGGDSEEGRSKAKRLMLYGIGAFVLILSVWAIVNILVSTFGFYNDRPLTSDYIEGGYGGSGSGSGSYECTSLAFGFEWCGQSSGWIPGKNPGAPPPVVDPNPPPTTNTLRFP